MENIDIEMNSEMRKGIYVYLWDLLDEGIENVLGNVKDCGLNEINLATGYHTGKFILPHNPQNRIKFIEDGVVYFPVNKEAFEEIGIYPEESKLISKKPDALEQIFKCAAKLDIKINSWHVMMHNTSMGTKYPELTVRNAFGDHYYHSLCPNNPRVQLYFSELFKVMKSSLDINEIFMESPGYMPYTHRAHHEHKSIDFSIMEEVLLSFCFCESCSKKAMKEGIDIERIKSETKNHIDKGFSAKGGQNETTQLFRFINLIVGDSDFVRFMKARNEWLYREFSALKKSLKKNAPALSVLGPANVSPSLLGWLEGVSPEKIVENLDQFMYLAYAQNIEDDARYIEDKIIAPGIANRCLATVSLCDPLGGSRNDLDQRLEMIKKLNMQGVFFYEYGKMRINKLKWIKESFTK